MIAMNMIKQPIISKEEQRLKPFLTALICPNCTSELTTLTTPIGLCIKKKYICTNCAFHVTIWDD